MARLHIIVPAALPVLIAFLFRNFLVIQDALVDPLGVSDLKELCDETEDPACSVGG